MAFNPELEVKALRARVDGLEKKIDALEKLLRALPDLAAIAKLVPRMDAAEKAIAGKKDAKSAEQEAAKQTAKMVAGIDTMTKDMVSKAVLDTRLKTLEIQVQQALALAAGKR